MTPNSELLDKYYSPARFAPYLYDSGGNESKAWSLYTWNATLSAAFTELLGYLEIPLRNALSSQLQIMHGNRPGGWVDDPLNILSARSAKAISEAKVAARKSMRKRRVMALTALPLDAVIAHLSFGFWRFLLTSTYEQTLWTPYLRHAFPYLQPQSRKKVEGTIGSLHILRNRIAHYEPIYRMPLQDRVEDIYGVLDWLNPSLSDIAHGQSNVERLLDQRPKL